MTAAGIQSRSPPQALYPLIPRAPEATKSVIYEGQLQRSSGDAVCDSGGSSPLYRVQPESAHAEAGDRPLAGITCPTLCLKHLTRPLIHSPYSLRPVGILLFLKDPFEGFPRPIEVGS